MLRIGDSLDSNGTTLVVKGKFGDVGGMGSVFLVEDPNSGQNFVAKAPAKNEQFLFKLMRAEYAALQRLQSTPYIVRAIDLVEFNPPAGSSFPVLIMEKAEGVSLEKAYKDGKFSYEDARDVMSKLAEALVEVHNQGYMHLDIKPANIIIDDPRGRNDITIIDFGIAARKSGMNTFCITEDRRKGGSKFFASPEQMKTGGHASCGSDIFSVGAVGFALIVGCEKTMEMADSEPPHRLAAPRLGLTAPPKFVYLHGVIERATWDERGGRYATINDLAEAIGGKEPDENFPCIGWGSKKFKLEGDGPWIIGRVDSAGKADIMVPETSPTGGPYISREHAKIEKRAEGVFRLFDMMSKNETRVLKTKGSARRWEPLGPQGYPLGSKHQQFCFAYADSPPNETDDHGNPLSPGPYKTIDFFPPRKQESTEI